MRLILAALGVAVLALPLFAQDWDLKKDKNGIKIYTKSVPGSSFKAFKGTTVLNAELRQVIAVIKDVEAYADWMPNSKRSEELSHPAETHQIYYLSTKAPWPVSDRDGVYECRIRHDHTSQTTTVRIQALPDYLPEKKNHVRITRTDGFWRLKDLGDGRTDVHYEVLAEPGGNIPAWLARSKVVSVPYETLTGLSARVKLAKYQDQTFTFLKQ